MMGGVAKRRRRVKERRETFVILAGVTVALILSIGLWPLYFKARIPSLTPQAPPFALPSSTGQTIALDDFLGKRDVVLIFYMTAT
jgi:hypothetical protein